MHRILWDIRRALSAAFGSTESGILKIAGIRFEHQWTSEEYLRWLEFHGWRVRFSKELGARIPLVYTECVRK